VTDDELEYSLDTLRDFSVQAFNRGDRVGARRLGFVFHALLRERRARFDQRGDNAGQRRSAVTGLTRTFSIHDGGNDEN
jgi:hypothetical protein